MGLKGSLTSEATPACLCHMPHLAPPLSSEVLLAVDNFLGRAGRLLEIQNG